MSTQPYWHTKAEAAEITKLSIRTIERMINTGALPARKIGRAVRIPASALEPDKLGQPVNPWLERRVNA